MIPTDSEKMEMARLRAILEDGFAGTQTSTPSIPSSTPNPADFYGGVTAPVINETTMPEPVGGISPPALPLYSSGQPDPMMSNFNAIVNGFVGSQSAVQTLTESNNPEIKEALVTKLVKDGVTIGKWKIVVNLVESTSNPDKKKKHFDIVHSATGDVIAKDLWLYEAAHGLVRHLNNGKPINSPEIKQIIHFEEKFSARKLDAINYAKKFTRANNSGDYQKANILEDRFDYAKSQALEAKAKITQLAKMAL